MDDEELTQDVLDQFDLVCTQFNGATLAKDNKRGNYMKTSETKKGVGGFRLSKTSSLDARSLSQSTVGVILPQSVNKAKDELVQLKNEMNSLREEFYMKVGELASLKESANRIANSRMETIRRLETQLTAEREEARKTLTALHSQLAFREADYTLVASELAQVKDVISSQHRPPLYLPNGCEASPASALLASLVESPVNFKTPQKTNSVTNNERQTHLPTVLTPIPTRRSKRQGLWHDELPTSSHKRTTGLKVVFFDKHPQAASGEEGILQRDPLLDGECKPTPCKRRRTGSLTPSSSQTTRHKASLSSQRQHPRLRFRTQLTRGGPCRNVVCSAEETKLQQRLRNISSQLLRLSILPCTRSINLHRSDWPEQKNDEQATSSVEANFFEGISLLTLPLKASFVNCFDKSLPLLLPQINHRLRECINFFVQYRKGVFDGVKTDALLNSSKSFATPVSTIPGLSSSSSHDNCPLNEDPFAGALASQVVPVPSLSFPKSQLSNSDAVGGNCDEVVTWLSEAAQLAIRSASASLRQLAVLLQNKSTSSSSLIAPLLTRLVSELAELFSIEVERELKFVWIQQLAALAERTTFLLASCLRDIESSGDLRPPTLITLLLISTHGLKGRNDYSPPPSGDSENNLLKCIAPHPFSCLFRLCAALIDGGHWPPLHQNALPTTSWWMSDDGKKGDIDVHLSSELCSRLQSMQVCFGQTVIDRLNGGSSLTDTVSDRLGCPLVLLCRLVQSDWKSSIPSASDSSPQECCSLLAQFSAFVISLVNKSSLSLSSSCSCTNEVYFTLINLGVLPVEWLFRNRTTGSELCLSALGCLTQALQSLLLKHGDAAFQTFTDRVPAFFSIISNLSRHCREEADSGLPSLPLLHPQLVEELNDFDASMSPQTSLA